MDDKPQRFVDRGLWRHADFRQLWAAQTVSQVGTQISLIAIPLIAALTLNVTPVEMGLLAAAESAPFVLLSLVAGVWIDRLPRKPIVITADLIRAVLLSSIPLAYAFDSLTLAQLFIVGISTTAVSVFFDIAYRSYLPVLIERQDLAEGNAKLEATFSGASIAGPALGGGLVALIGAPFALIIDAVSFVGSAAFLARIRTHEERPEPRSGATLRSDISSGLRIVFSNPLLRAIIGCSATWRFFDSVVLAVVVLFITRELGLGAGAVGIVLSSIGVGLLLGSVVAPRISRSIGIGRGVIAGATMSSVGGAFIALASGPDWLAVGILMAGFFLLGVGGSVFGINAMTIRQSSVPQEFQGRMNASYLFAVSLGGPLGFAAGGLLGSAIGLRATLVVGAVGGIVGFLWVLLSPLRSMSETSVDSHQMMLPADAFAPSD